MFGVDFVFVTNEGELTSALCLLLQNVSVRVGTNFKTTDRLASVDTTTSSIHMSSMSIHSFRPANGVRCFVLIFVFFFLFFLCSTSISNERRKSNDQGCDFVSTEIDGEHWVRADDTRRIGQVSCQVSNFIVVIVSLPSGIRRRGEKKWKTLGLMYSYTVLSEKLD